MNIQNKKILIKTKKQVFSGILGNNSSLLKGEGYDFLELKEYEYGEDVKNIDWVVSAKMQKPYVKVFHAQKELNINIISLLNGSTYFGSKKFKKDVICEVASLLAFSCVKQKDPFSSFIANEKLINITNKSKKTFFVSIMLEEMSQYNVLGKDIFYEKIINEIYKKIKQKSIIFLIGDFFDINKLDLKLLCKKHEVFVIIIRDTFEENPSILGSVNFIDPANALSFDGIISKETVKKYKEELKRNDKKLFAHLQKCSIKNTKIYTHEEILPKIIKLLK